MERKDVMNRLVKSFHHLLTDVSHLSGHTLCAPDDYGIEQVTKELPKLDKHLLAYLEVEDILTPEDVNLRFPDWLSPLWSQFLRTKDPTTLKLLRQVLVFGYKARFEPSDEQIKASSDAFMNTDAIVDLLESSVDFNSLLFRTAQSIVARVTGVIDWQEIVPFHGPGSVFPNCDPIDRSNFTTIIRKIDDHYNFWEYFFGLGSFLPNAREIYSHSWRESLSPIRGKLVFVPKDSRGPRTICVHPKESIWIQQGQRILLESSAKRILRGHLNFDDQSVNAALALKSSLDQQYCTIDLKDASDRLGCRTVRFLLGDYVYDKLSCSRLEEVQLPCGRVIALKKWAPMGNALCFPVESLVFYALARASIQMKFGTKAGLNVYVFGDDIIVPSNCYDVVIQALESVGLAANRQKCFVRGFFRESCGVEAYKGLDVTPHRMKVHRITSQLDIVAICEFAKNLLADGYASTAGYLYSSVRRYLKDRNLVLPITNNDKACGIVEYSPVALNRVYDYNSETNFRWNHSLHRYEVRLLQARASIARLKDDRCHLLDAILRLERSAVVCLKSGRSGYPVPHRTCLSWGWTEVGFEPISVTDPISDLAREGLS